MKKIATWKVAVLSLITLGIYAVVWAARARTYLVTKHKNVKVPRPLWLAMLYVIGALAVFMAMIVGIMAAFSVMTAGAAVLAMNIIIVVSTLAVVVLGGWWVWHFAGAMQQETGNHIPRGWAVALFIFVGAWLAAFYQYYINKADGKSLKGGPSTGFIILSIVLISLSLGLSASSFRDYGTDLEALEHSIHTMQAETDEVFTLQKEYMRCASQLEVEYPGGEAEAEDKTAYQQDAARCDDLYEKYNQRLNEL